MKVILMMKLRKDKTPNHHHNSKEK